MTVTRTELTYNDLSIVGKVVSTPTFEGNEMIVFQLFQESSNISIKVVSVGEIPKIVLGDALLIKGKLAYDKRDQELVMGASIILPLREDESERVRTIASSTDVDPSTNGENSQPVVDETPISGDSLDDIVSLSVEPTSKASGQELKQTVDSTPSQVEESSVPQDEVSSVEDVQPPKTVVSTFLKVSSPTKPSKEEQPERETPVQVKDEGPAKPEPESSPVSKESEPEPVISPQSERTSRFNIDDFNC